MHYVHFSKGIDPQSTHELISALAVIANNQDQEVTLFMNSNGGNVVAGIHCYNMVSALPINLTVHNVGNVDSIANVIFLAGNHRLCSPPSTFMFHSVGFDQPGPVRLEERNLRQWLDSVVADNKRMGGIIASRTNLSERRAGALFREQRVRDAAWALQHGFVHQVAAPQIPTGANITHLT
jgi:ATP-dependent Clp protease, protease subunit